MEHFLGYFKNGQRVVRKSFCAYFDILGFSGKIENSFKKSTEEKYSYFEKYLKILEEELKFIKSHSQLLNKNDEQFSIKIFTDNFVIGFPWYDEYGESELGTLVTVLSHVQNKFLENDIFIRGAIAISDLHMDENIIIGPALIEAYKLESEKALYPRIILSRDVEDMVLKYTNYYAQKYDSPQNKEFIRDKDGLLFVNYLRTLFSWAEDQPKEQEKLLRKHKKIIMQNSEINRKCNKILMKYLWCAEYHNYFINNFTNNYNELLINIDEIELKMERIIKSEE